MDLKLEINKKFIEDSDVKKLSEKGLLITPPLNEDYWIYRVKLDNGQAVLGFPKFGIVGCGFAIEEDWNCNLPTSICTPEEIYEHIKHNQKPSIASKEYVLEAIRLIKEQADKK